jgi:hypothetical protein
MTAHVIPSRFYVHKPTGRTISIFGACPWRSDAEKADFEVYEKGFTIQWPDGSVGTGKPAFETAEAAQAYIDARPGFKGMSTYYN